MNVEVATMEDRLHRAMLAWQERHFRDFRHLRERWAEYYTQEPFRLVAKMSALKTDAIEVGDRAGRPKFAKTKEMDEETLERCRTIIRAQASTELGSIQQHRQTLHKAQDPRMQFDVLRVMAEEFRH